MNTLIKDIEETLEKGKRIMADNSCISSLSIDLNDYPYKEVEAAAEYFKREITYVSHNSTITFVVSTDFNNHTIFVHVYSGEVKIVYE